MRETKPVSRNQLQLGVLLACACGAILLLFYTASCGSQQKISKNYHVAVDAAEYQDGGDSHGDGGNGFEGAVFLGEQAGGCFPRGEGWGGSSAIGYDYDGFMKSATSSERTDKCAMHAKAITLKTRPIVDDTDPLVAVCMVGNARTLPNTGVYKRVVSNLLKPLSARTMLFAHLKSWDTPTKEQKKHGGFRSVPVTDDNLAKAIRHLRPVYLRIDKGGTHGDHNKNYTNHDCKFTTEMATEQKQPDFYVGKYSDRFIGQMFSMYECYESVLAFEKKANITFHAIAKIRPDVTWFYPMLSAMELVWERSDVVTHLADQFIFAPRKFSDGFRMWWQDYAKCKGVWKGAYFPEKAYEDAFKKLGANYYDDKKTPQVIRRVSATHENRQSAVVACGRQRRITNLTRCLELVYERDGAYN